MRRFTKALVGTYAIAVFAVALASAAQPVEAHQCLARDGKLCGECPNGNHVHMYNSGENYCSSVDAGKAAECVLDILALAVCDDATVSFPDEDDSAGP